MPSALFVHNSFPGQFDAIGRALVSRGWECAAIGREHASSVPGVNMVRYHPKRGPSPQIFPPAAKVEEDMICGAHVAEKALELRDCGFSPHVIIGHPGWGETLYLREIFPGARQILYAEYYYNPRGGDGDFDPEFYEASSRFDVMVRSRSAALALAYCHADVLVAPSQYQASTLPAALSSRTRVIHEGVDTTYHRRRSTPSFQLPDGGRLGPNHRVITFASRTLEPHRGFHRFMRALPHVQRQHADTHALIMGDADGPGYGQRPAELPTWKDSLLGELKGTLDLSRVHFLGKVSRDVYVDALSISDAHVYFTYPFTLSWSLVEAMSLECVVIASDAPPVTEVIAANENGILVGFFDQGGLVSAITRVCSDPSAFDHIRRGARATAVSRFDQRSVCLPAWLELIEGVASS